MLSVLYFSFNAVAPVLLMVLLGYCGRRAGMLDLPALKQMNAFNFRFGFSALMLVNLYDAEETTETPWNLAWFLLAALAVLTLTGWAAARLFTAERKRKAVLMMAAYRSNYASIGLAMVLSTAGSAGLGTASMMQLPTVLYFNVVSTLILGYYAESGNAVTPGRILGKLIRNPLILGLSAGIGVRTLRSVTGFALSETLPWLYTAFTWLARMSTPLALIVLGGQLEPGEAGAFRRELIAGIAARLIAAPVIGFAMAALAVRQGWIALDAGGWAMLTAAFASPMAVSSVVMSAEMGADDRLCGQLVVWTSILGLPALFVITAVLRALRLL